MRNFEMVVIAAAISSSVIVSAKADDTTTKQAIQAVYDKRSAAYSKQDADAFVALLTDDYTEIAAKGATIHKSKESKLKRLQRLWKFTSSIDDHVTIRKVVPQGKDAIVTVDEDYNRTETKGVREGSIHQASTVRAFWVNTPSGWLLKQEHIIKLTRTVRVDGAQTELIVNPDSDYL